MTAFEIDHNDACMYSDMYKDAYGSRPRTKLVVASQEEFDQVIMQLSNHIEYDLAQQTSWEIQAYDAWIAGIHKLARETNNTIRDVVRWAFEAENLRINDKHDQEYFCYLNGLGHLHHRLIAKIK